VQSIANSDKFIPQITKHNSYFAATVTSGSIVSINAYSNPIWQLIPIFFLYLIQKEASVFTATERLW